MQILLTSIKDLPKWEKKYIYMKCKGLRIAKTILKNRNKIGRLMPFGFKTCYKAIVIYIVWYWHKNKYID